MAEHDDAVDVMGDERERPSRASHERTSGNPIGRAWQWFTVQPAQTKVIILGVIVVLGVVIWMALRNKNSSQTTDQQDETQPGKFSPLGQFWKNKDTTPAATTPATTPVSTSPAVVPPGPTAITSTIAASSASPVQQAAAYKPPVTFPTQATPASASAASKVIARISLPRGSTPVYNVRPTVITAVPTNRGTNVDYGFGT